jgi:hypothetical protein
VSFHRGDQASLRESLERAADLLIDGQIAWSGDADDRSVALGCAR